MVAAVGTSSAGSVAGSDFVVHTAVEAHTEVDTNFGIDWVDMILALVQPDPAPHFSLSRCQ